MLNNLRKSQRILGFTFLGIAALFQLIMLSHHHEYSFGYEAPAYCDLDHESHLKSNHSESCTVHQFFSGLLDYSNKSVIILDNEVVRILEFYSLNRITNTYLENNSLRAPPASSAV